MHIFNSSQIFQRCTVSSVTCNMTDCTMVKHCWRVYIGAHSQFVWVPQVPSAPAQCQCHTNYPRLSPGNIPSPVTSMGTMSSSSSIGDTASAADILHTYSSYRDIMSTPAISYSESRLQANFIISRLELLLDIAQVRIVSEVKWHHFLPARW